MQPPKLCYPNWTLPTATVTPTITGASWIDLANLQGEVPSEMARYPGVNPANTKLLIDLGTLRNVSVVAIPLHNGGNGDKARIRVATDAGLTNIVLDTGWQEFYGEMYPYGTLPWGSPQWLDGRMSPEQIAALAADAPPVWFYVSPTEVIGRYLDVQFDFSNNASGVVDTGQIVASPAFSPANTFSYGAKPPYYRDPSTARRSKGGARFVDKARRYRVAQMQFELLSGIEVWGPLFEMCRDYGTTKPFLYIHDSDAEPAIRAMQTFMAVAEKMGEPVYKNYRLYSMAAELSEVF